MVTKSRTVHKTGFFALVLLLLSTLEVFGQECMCPVQDECGPCSGGISSFTLLYEGNVNASISIRDGLGEVYSGTITPDQTFIVNSRGPNEGFIGQFLEVYISLALETQINAQCNVVAVGQKFGDFKIRAASSVNGGPICCPTELLDTTSPVIINCPSNREVVLPQNACSVAVSWPQPAVSDNCGTPVLTVSNASGSLFEPGATTVTYTAIDRYGNQSTCNFTVTVTDNTPPVFTSCPSNIQLSANNNCGAVANWANPTAQDNCSVNVVGSHTSGSVFPLGTTTVTYTATDPGGNQATCSFTVTVVDNSPPAFNSCPLNVVQDVVSGCSRTVSWTAPVVQDNCSFTLTASHVPGTNFPVGVTTVSYTATDQAGNQATCSFTVTIRDNINPVLSNCPANIVLTADESCTAVASWTPPTAQDNCPVNVTTNRQPGTAFPIGNTTVTYTATDPSGNTATCSFTVTVNNTQTPILESCPENIIVETDENNTAVVTWDEPEFSIACGELSITKSHEPGDVFHAGTTQVVYTARQVQGTAVECRFTVTVNRKNTTLMPSRAITPNGDGIQDVWVIANIELHPNNRVVVVDRRGGVVYEASGYNNDSVVWTGANTSGNLLPTGTYFYRIETRQPREVITGSIELVR
ncbi:MAG: HYR domain-containing protein [Cyclobacteriaceae bacterium]|nr:HYR domain-containing protein [Cyclobacteriaceae bacterium]